MLGLKRLFWARPPPPDLIIDTGKGIQEQNRLRENLRHEDGLPPAPPPRSAPRPTISCSSRYNSGPGGRVIWSLCCLDHFDDVEGYY
jgi:hypothetical protein